MSHKIDRLRAKFSRSPKPSTSHSAPTIPAANASSVPSPLRAAALPPRRAINSGLSLAIQRHVDALPEAEKQMFLGASTTLNEDNILLHVKRYDDAHSSASHSRPQAENISRFLSILDRFAAVISIGTEASTPLATIVVGAARAVISVAVDFVTYFTRLSEMLCRLGDFLEPLKEYGEASISQLIAETLASVYGDLLQFCQKASRLFTDAARGGVQKKGVSWRVFWRNQWLPFEEEFGDIETNWNHHLDVLSHASQALGLNTSLEVLNRDRQRTTRERVAERESFLYWLSTMRYEEAHTKHNAARHIDTGKWIFKSTEFGTWFDSPKSELLWCFGKPGAGKSVLASSVVEHIATSLGSRTEIGIAFVYCTYELPETQKVSCIITAIIKQLCQKRFDVPTGFIKTKQDGHDPSASLGNFDSLALVAHNFEEIYLVIDALDECAEDSRYQVIDLLLGMLGMTTPRIKVFVTSRPESDIHVAFENVTLLDLQAQATKIDADIYTYVKSETEQLCRGYNGKKLYVREEPLKNKIVDTLAKKADGMFLWVNLQLEELCRVSRSRQDDEVDKALGKVLPGLDKTYARILERIDAQSEYMKTLALSCFRWVLYAQRTLAVEELVMAVAFEQTQEYNPKPDLGIEVVLEACANLIVVENRGEAWDYPYRAILVVREVHFSVREYFITRSNAFGSCLASVHHKTSHDQLATTCLQWLLSGRLNGEYDALKRDLLFDSVRKDRFCWYAARCFDYHLIEARTCSLILQRCLDGFLGQSSSLHGTILILKGMREVVGHPTLSAWYAPGISDRELRTSTTSQDLILATKLSQLPSLQVAAKDLTSSTMALHLACSSGSTEIVPRLLQHGFEVNSKNDDGETPLYLASSRGYTEIVRLLLGANAEVNIRGGSGTALQGAVVYGHEDIVRILLSSGAKVDVVPEDAGKALLQRAAEKGYENIVRLLLDAGADINMRGSRGRNALDYAALSGRTEIVRLLILRKAEVNPEYCDKERFLSPLQCACFGGKNPVVALLLDAGAAVNARCSKYGNALHIASGEGDLATVQLLLERGAAEIDHGNCNPFCWAPGKSALAMAVSNGDGDVARFLISRGANVQHRDRKGANLLHAALAWGRLELLQKLLSASTIRSLNTPDLRGWSLLHYVATSYHALQTENSEVVLRWAQAESLSVDVADRQGWTPLHWLAHVGRVTWIKLLLAAGADRLKEDHQGWTPYHVAAYQGHTHLLEMLSLPDIDKELVSIRGKAYFTDRCQSCEAVSTKSEMAARAYGWLRA